jgi:hypothetical protein
LESLTSCECIAATSRWYPVTKMYY